jgi:PAS domain S-box-containing protein/putative nucleotidyltransferase with HDIG domain
MNAERKPRTKSPRAGGSGRLPSQRAKTLTAIQETIFDLVTHHSLPELLTAIVQRAATLLDAPGGGLYLVEAGKRSVRCVVSYNTVEDFSGTVLAYGEGAAGRVAETGAPLIVDDYVNWPGRAKIYADIQALRAVISAPLIWRGEVTGVITVLREEAFTQADLDILIMFANHAAVAVENARLYGAVEQELAERKRDEEALRENEKRARELFDIAQRQAQELSLLDKVRTAIANELELTALLRRVVQSISETFGYTLVSIYLLEGEELILQRQVGYERTIPRIPLSQGVCGRVASSGKAEFLMDVSTDPDFLKAIENVLSEICIPFFVNGKVAGVLNVESKDVRLTDADMQFMSALSEHVGMAVSQARLYEDIKRRNQLLSALHESSLALMKQTERTETLQAILAQATQLLNASHGYIYLVQPEENVMQVILGVGVFEKYQGWKLKPNEGLAGKVWQTAQPINVRDYVEWEGRSEQYADPSFHAAVGVPLIYNDRVIGVLGLSHLEPGRVFSENDLDLLSYFARLAAVALQNANLFTRVQHELEERIQAQDALRAAEEQYRLLVERLPLVVYTAELGWNGVWYYISPQIQSLLGFTVQEWLADSSLWYRLIHPDDRLRQEALENQSGATGQPFDSEYRIYTKDGREIWARDLGHILPAKPGGQPIVQGVMTDITDRKRAEQVQSALYRIAEAAQTSEDLPSFYEAVHQIMCGLMPAANFYISLYDPVEDMFNMAYLRDEIADANDWTRYKPGKGLGAYILRTGKPIRTTPEIFEQLEQAGEVEILMRRMVDYIGVPLKSSQGIIGVMATQTYNASQRLTEADKDMMVFVSTQVATAIERKRTEAALRESEERYRLLVSTSPSPIFLHQDGRFVFVNPAGLKLLSATGPEDLIGKPILDVVHPDYRAVVAQRVRGATEAGMLAPMIEEKFLRLDGSIVDVEVAAASLTLNGKKTMMVIAHDISERKQVEAALRVAEENYRNLVEQIPAVVYLDWADESSTSYYISPQVETLLGYPPSAYVENPTLWHRQIFPEDYEKARATVSKTLEQGEAVEEYRLVAKDGRVLWVRDTSVLIRDEQGAPKYIQGLLEDIAESKRAQQLQASIYEIARASMSVQSLDELYVKIHEVLQTLLPTQYFYIALYDREHNLVSFPYFQDAFDFAPPPSKPSHGLTEYVLRTRKPLLATREERSRLIEAGEVELIGADSIEWLGVPLIVQEEAIGVMVVQSYEESVHFSRQDMEVMTYVSTQVASAIERKRAEQALRESEERFHSLFDNATVGMYRTTPDGRILLSNPAAVRMLGYASFEELAERNLEQNGYEPGTPRSEFRERMEREGTVIGLESAWTRKDGSIMFVRESATAVRDNQGRVLYYDGTFEDISARKQAEDALRRSESFTRSIVENEPECVKIVGPGGILRYMNPAGLAMMEVEDVNAVFGKSVYPFIAPEHRQAFMELIERVLRGETGALQFQLTGLRGTTRWLDTHAVPLYDDEGKVESLLGITRDITERKQAEALQEAVYRIASAAETALSVNDLFPQIHQIIFSVMPAENFFIALYDEPNNILRFPYFKDVQDEPYRDQIAPGKGLTSYVLRTGKSLLCTREVHEELVRQGAVSLLGVPSKIWLGVPLVVEGKTIGVMVVQHYSDPQAYGQREQHILEFVSSQVAVTIRRKQSEQALRESEERYRSIIEQAMEGMIIYDVNTRRVLEANPAYQALLGYTAAEINNLTLYDLSSHDRANIDMLIERIRREKRVWIGERKHRHKDGSLVDVEVNASLIAFRGQEALLVVVRDTTERRKAERELRESEERYRTLFSGMLDGVYRSTHEGKFMDVNPAMVKLFGYDSREEMLQMDIKRDLYFAPEERESLFLDTGQEKVDIFRMKRKDGSEIWVEDHGHYVHDSQGKVIFHEGILRDVTERIQADHEINRLLQESQQRLRQVEALRSIDLAIGSSMDLRTTLNILLSYIKSLLSVDAAGILLFNPNSQSFEFAAGTGYRTRLLESMLMPMGNSMAGKVALERRPLQFADPPELLTNRDIQRTWKNEGFVSYTGIPLIAKGELKGVLEVYHRTPFEADAQWMDLFQNFSIQASIAIENAQMFNELQRSNFELSLAYDATIEGWSRALELREYEAIGHAQRITDLTLELARDMGVRDADMVHIRRGALLHDIGKMGIPDSILLKPSDLTEEEWKIIRKHPTLAYEMLSPIAYLRQALDIPYCHHERWDGFGYPRGLAGEEIPPAARIFAVADAYEAMTSDRIFRKRISKEEAMHHLQAEAGKQFDPKVVAAFLQLAAEGHLP